ncbi:MAG TPA: ABC transporter ATP-binding protein [Patescibacteria group bacterium]|nr:ABC transporter ATP-binding protein [Patescibacteria group bacterium]
MLKNAQTLIELKDVVKRYPLDSGEYYQALNGITLSIKKGEFVAIMGPSGSGKSTLMHILGALDVVSSGKYLLKEKDVSTYTNDQLAEIRNKEIGFVFQTFNLLARTTVFKNVERPMFYANIAPQERKKRTMSALELVGILDKANNLSNRISGGQIQRVAIARALIMNPSIILADEPTGNLDSKTSLEIISILQKLNDLGHTIIVITHEESIAKFARRKIKMVDGKIISDTVIKK